MDTSNLEHIAEDRISSELQGAGLLVAKPKFDEKGTDLLVYLEMDDGAWFCRVQCKGRSLKSSNSSSIKIPVDYVTNGFLVALFLEVSEQEKMIYVFLPSEIREWNKSNGDYRLSLYKPTVIKNLKQCLFDKTKVGLINTLIRGAEFSGNFQNLVYASGSCEIARPTSSGVARVK